MTDKHAPLENGWYQEAYTGHYVWEDKGISVYLEPTIYSGSNLDWYLMRIYVGPATTTKDIGAVGDVMAREIALEKTAEMVKTIKEAVDMAVNSLGV